MSDNEFKHESYEDRETILDYLKSITQGIERGTISLGNQKNRIDLEPDGLLKFKLEAKRKDDRSKFSLQVSWKHDPKENKAKSKDLLISLATD